MVSETDTVPAHGGEKVLVGHLVPNKYKLLSGVTHRNRVV